MASLAGSGCTWSEFYAVEVIYTCCFEEFDDAGCLWRYLVALFLCGQNWHTYRLHRLVWRLCDPCSRWLFLRLRGVCFYFFAVVVGFLHFVVELSNFRLLLVLPCGALFSVAGHECLRRYWSSH